MCTLQQLAHFQQINSKINTFKDRVSTESQSFYTRIISTTLTVANKCNYNTSKSAFSLVQHDAARVCCWVPAPAAHCPQRAHPHLSVDVSRQQGARRQNPPVAVAAAVDGTDRRTEWRTPHRYIDSALHILRAASTTFHIQWLQHNQICIGPPEHRFHSPQPNTSLYYKLRGYGSGRCIMWFAAFAYCAYT